MAMRQRPDERGAAAVEFALVVPMLFVLVFGMIDFGYAINRYTVVNNATREGARAASLGDTEAEVRTAITDALGDMASSSTITVTCQKPDGTACASWTSQESGGVALITVQHKHKWITPVGGMVAGGGLDLTKNSRMRIE